MLLREGHIDQMCRVAVAARHRRRGRARHGVAARARAAHGLLDRGAIAPGYLADLVLLEDLERFEPALVIKDGERRGGRPSGAGRRAGLAAHTMHIAPVAPDDLRVPRAAPACA